MKLSVVIPARNEEGSIGDTVVVLHKTLKRHSIIHQIIVVDDGSTDETRAVLKELKASVSVLKVISNSSAHGFGMAVRRGLKSFDGDAVAVYMADGSDNPLDLVRFWKELERSGVDCVFGTRFAKEAQVVDYPRLKYLLNRLANGFIKLLFNLEYNDTTNAFKLYRRSVIEGVQPLLSPHFNLTVEIPLKAIVRGYTYKIIPNDWHNRKSGVSKLKIKEMGSRYLFIILYCFIEKWLSRGDYHRSHLEEGDQA